LPETLSLYTNTTFLAPTGPNWSGIRELGSCKTGADTDKAERERDTGDQLKCFSH